MTTASATPLPPLPTPSGKLLEYLDKIGVSYRVYEHAPVFTVAESEHLTATVPGVHCRNLFVRDKKETMFLVVAPDHTPVDLKALSERLGCGRLSFGSPARLWTYLGVRPGSVCPFAIINDTGNAVTVVLDRAMMEAPLVTYHPMENDKSIVLAPADLLKFIESCSHTPHIVDLNPAA